MKSLIKGVAQVTFLILVFIPAALTGFGRSKSAFTFFAHLFALGPGLLGDYLRSAYYHLTLTSCALSSRISFGAFFAHPQASVGEKVYIGPYCVFGRAEIGDHCQIATGVQILSGNQQHVRDEAGRISGAEQGEHCTVRVGSDCWIGAAAIIMAEVGAGSTIGAGSVVTREIPPGSVAVGSPARVVPQGVAQVVAQTSESRAAD